MNYQIVHANKNEPKVFDEMHPIPKLKKKGFEKTMIHAARSIFAKLILDVYIFTDHKAGPQAGEYVFFLKSMTLDVCFKDII